MIQSLPYNGLFQTNKPASSFTGCLLLAVVQEEVQMRVYMSTERGSDMRATRAMSMTCIVIS